VSRRRRVREATKKNVIFDCVCRYFYGVLATGCYFHLSFNQSSIALNSLKCAESCDLCPEAA
jgi:hypothetical protein